MCGFDSRRPLQQVNNNNMAKTKQTNGALKAITQPLAEHIASWHANAHTLRHKHLQLKHNTQTLPPLLLVLALQGEGVLRQRFFGSAVGDFGHQLPHTPSPEQWLHYWQSFVLQNGHIADLVRRIGLINALSVEAHLPQADDDLCMQLYLALLGMLSERKLTQLETTATTQFFGHLFKQLFPHEAATPKPKKDSSTLQNQLERALRKLHQQPITLKESYTQTDDLVTFTLRMQLNKKGAWQDLITVQRPRLRSARLFAYQTLLKQMQG